MLTTLLYVSHCSIPSHDTEAVVQQIVKSSSIANHIRDVTGALLFTGTYFAQVIEGKAETIDTLFASLARDPRHDQITIADRSLIRERRFKNWDMEYLGPSQFVSRHVTRLLNDPPAFQQSRAAAWLIELMEEFARA